MTKRKAFYLASRAQGSTDCRACGGKAIPGLDRDMICPECQRLTEFYQDMQIEDQSDEMAQNF